MSKSNPSYFSDDENEENEDENEINSVEDEEDEEEGKEMTDDEEDATEEAPEEDAEDPAGLLRGEFEDEDEEDDDEDESELYLQKFDSEVNKNYIVDVHPECAIHNKTEIMAMTVVVRDVDGTIVDDLHRTLPFLTKFERSRIIGQRASQINSGSAPFIKDIPNNIIDGYLIAEMELESKSIPFIIRRPLPNGGSEYWRVNDLENIGF